MAGPISEKIAQAGRDRGLDVPAELTELELNVTQEPDQDSMGAEQAVKAFGETIRQMPDLDRMMVLRMLIDELSV